MSPTPQPDETSLIAEWAWKIAGVFVAFVGGIVSATWAIAGRVHGFEKSLSENSVRLDAVEKAQSKCQAETLVKLADKMDELPGKIEEKMEARFNRIHERIDEALLGRRNSDNTPPRPHVMD